MVALDAVHLTSTMSSPVEELQLTTPKTVPAKPRRDLKRVLWLRSRLGNGTVLDVDPAERGDEEERNQATPPEGDRRQGKKEPETIEDGEGSRVRSELARDLVQRVDQLLPLLGDVSLATHIGLLKRDLSRCHDALKDHPGESNYLSVVTLVESAMAQLKWKQYGKPQLETIRQALDIGYRQVRVNFGDYEKARRLFSQQRVDSTPRIDLESLKWEDITDAEEE
jgi:hypothetical protein